MNEEEPDEETLKGWYNDRSNWIWGLFYYNPRDKRTFVSEERKVWTRIDFNFARPGAYLMVAVIAVFMVLIVKIGR